MPWGFYPGALFCLYIHSIKLKCMYVDEEQLDQLLKSIDEWYQE